MPEIQNKEEIFGNQLYFDENDNMSGKENRLLLVPSRITFEKAQNIVLGAGGVLIPAHIDRNSYSILSVLGSVPPEFKGKFLEISLESKKERVLAQYPELDNFRFIYSSDAQDNLSETAISSIINALID